MVYEEMEVPQPGSLPVQYYKRAYTYTRHLYVVAASLYWLAGIAESSSLGTGPLHHHFIFASKEW